MKFIATDGCEYEASFYLCEIGAIGWRPLGDHMPHWPHRLAAFAEGEPDESDSLWREGPTPTDATFTIIRPGARRVLLTRDAEVELS